MSDEREQGDVTKVIEGEVVVANANFTDENGNRGWYDYDVVKSEDYVALRARAESDLRESGERTAAAHREIEALTGKLAEAQAEIEWLHGWLDDANCALTECEGTHVNADELKTFCETAYRRDGDVFNSGWNHAIDLISDHIRSLVPQQDGGKE